MSKSTLCSLPAAFTVLVTLAWLSTAADNENPVPEDFEVFAQYGPGFSGWKAWNTTITKDGTVVQQVFEDSDWKAKNGPALS